MTEGEFFTALKATLDAGLAARGITGITVQKGYQPRIIGAPDGMAILLWRVNLHSYGYPYVLDRWVPSDPPTVPPSGAMVHTEKQIYEISVQVTGSVKQPPPNPTKGADNLLPYTASDLCKIAGRILQSVAGVAELKATGIGTQKLAQIPIAYFKDESDAFQQNPNFTLVFTFTDTETTSTPIIVKTSLKVVPV